MSTFSIIVVSILGLLVITFPLLSRMLAEKSGWKALEAEFKTDLKRNAVKGSTVNLYSAVIGGLSYTNILRCKISKNGLYVSTVWPFSWAHNAIIIPWKAFTGITESSNMLKSYKRISVGRPEITTLDLDEKGFNMLKKYFRERSRLNF